MNDSHSERLRQRIELIKAEWEQRIQIELPNLNRLERASIIEWLLGEDRARLETIDLQQLIQIHKSIDYRFWILTQRYLGRSPNIAYKHLIERLGNAKTVYLLLSSGIAMSRDRHRRIFDVITEIVQDILEKDRNMQRQIAWIDRLTTNPRLKQALTIASIEEYCLRPVNNRSLLAHRCLNYLDREHRFGVTQIPRQNYIQVVFEPDESIEGYIGSFFDSNAIADRVDRQASLESKSLYDEIVSKLRISIADSLGVAAGIWIELYLQGKNASEIADILNMDIDRVYRLREKIDYHINQVFAFKNEAALVARWLNISLQEHNLGLTTSEWQQLNRNLTPIQVQIVNSLKVGNSIAEIAKYLNLKTSQVMGEWRKVYFAARSIRSKKQEHNRKQPDRSLRQMI